MEKLQFRGGGVLKMITKLYCGFREKLNIDIQIKMDERKS